MIFVFTLVSLLFLPILSFKEIKPKCCFNCKSLNEDAKFNKLSLFIKEQMNDVYSLLNGFGKMYTEKYKKKCILNEKETDKEPEKETESETETENEKEPETEQERYIEGDYIL
jgi:hypothetical protein